MSVRNQTANASTAAVVPTSETIATTEDVVQQTELSGVGKKVFSVLDRAALDVLDRADGKQAWARAVSPVAASVLVAARCAVVSAYAASWLSDRVQESFLDLALGRAEPRANASLSSAVGVAAGAVAAGIGGPVAAAGQLYSLFFSSSPARTP